MKPFDRISPFPIRIKKTNKKTKSRIISLEFPLNRAFKEIIYGKVMITFFVLLVFMSNL